MDVPVLPNQWTPIAERPRSAVATRQLTRTQAANPILTIAEARDLAATGAVLLANWHTDEKIILVVRPSTGHLLAAK